MNKGYINFGRVGRDFQVNVHWLELKALGMPHLHGQELQVLAGCVPTERKDIEPVISARSTFLSYS